MLEESSQQPGGRLSCSGAPQWVEPQLPAAHCTPVATSLPTRLPAPPGISPGQAAYPKIRVATQQVTGAQGAGGRDMAQKLGGPQGSKGLCLQGLGQPPKGLWSHGPVGLSCTSYHPRAQVLPPESPPRLHCFHLELPQPVGCLGVNPFSPGLRLPQPPPCLTPAVRLPLAPFPSSVSWRTLVRLSNPAGHHPSQEIQEK